jgi:hypothetical protein
VGSLEVAPAALPSQETALTYKSGQRLRLSQPTSVTPLDSLQVAHRSATLPGVIGRLDKSYQAEGRTTADPHDDCSRRHQDSCGTIRAP